MDYRDAYLRCPNCGRVGEITFHPHPRDIRLVTCGFCGHNLPVYSGIPDFAEHITLADRKLNPA